MPNNDSSKNTPKSDATKVGGTSNEKKGFWKRKFSNGNAGRSIKDGFTLGRLVIFLMLAVAIITFVHGAESPPTLKSFLEWMRAAPRLELDALYVPKLDFGSGVRWDTLEKAINSIVEFINLGNIGAVAIYNLLVALWYVLTYLIMV